MKERNINYVCDSVWQRCGTSRKTRVWFLLFSQSLKQPRERERFGGTDDGRSPLFSRSLSICLCVCQCVCECMCVCVSVSCWHHVPPWNTAARLQKWVSSVWRGRVWRQQPVCLGLLIFLDSLSRCCRNASLRSYTQNKPPQKVMAHNKMFPMSWRNI